ncbi:Uma2 family endonuclease [Streptomyces olivaceus]|uniref:Uma2 family endonuclease n=1 Tax=Streptomyces TaxID=1883 RepID=UPI001CCD35D0|nr:MULTISPECIES: Uma2 family endonuclease [Streptomyces]MBZ6134094.1 Uma2 family endonuclease [Streptomyces olivaceus]MBZ6250150.1 Uma2 family endonuclease [Streptomyces olivaceus]MCU8593161.1 Uma2 family endonuclease [Streptomyces sp. A13(2022)]WFB86604.1 Uma2 family endonuclease [Streptomyces olivaceus]WGK46203.1 Uma2 family endonuclease [Streptomyces sp. B146]
MTVTADRPQMLVTEFEELARHAERSIEGARLEFISGHLGGKAVPDGDHGRVIQWLTRICMQHRPDLWLDPTQGLVVEAYRGGRARPDGSLAPAEAFVGQGEWADPAPVLMVVEVTSYDSDTDRRDRVDKPRAYAETGIPVYLLIDRDTCEIKVHSRPDGGQYETVQTLPFGKEVALPEPVGIALDTEPLKNWVR